MPRSHANCSTASRSRRAPSLRFNVEQTVRVAGAARSPVSDNWQLLSRCVLFTRWPASGRHLDQALEVIDEALVSLVAVGGLEMAHMTRDQGWRFLTLGRHSSVCSSSTTLENNAAIPPPMSILEWLLELSDSVLTTACATSSDRNGSRSSI
jgi:uncharacterized alpha-E superfamily protein